MISTISCSGRDELITSLNMLVYHYYQGAKRALIDGVKETVHIIESGDSKIIYFPLLNSRGATALRISSAKKMLEAIPTAIAQ